MNWFNRASNRVGVGAQIIKFVAFSVISGRSPGQKKQSRAGGSERESNLHRQDHENIANIANFV
jgi:hypothetical protein